MSLARHPPSVRYSAAVVTYAFQLDTGAKPPPQLACTQLPQLASSVFTRPFQLYASAVRLKVGNPTPDRQNLARVARVKNPHNWEKTAVILIVNMFHMHYIF